MNPPPSSPLQFGCDRLTSLLTFATKSSQLLPQRHRLVSPYKLLCYKDIKSPFVIRNSPRYRTFVGCLNYSQYFSPLTVFTQPRIYRIAEIFTWCKLSRMIRLPLKVLTAQLVPHQVVLCRKNKNCENFLGSLWWHFRNSLHPQKFSAIRYME